METEKQISHSEDDFLTGKVDLKDLSEQLRQTAAENDRERKRIRDKLTVVITPELQAIVANCGLLSPKTVEDFAVAQRVAQRWSAEKVNELWNKTIVPALNGFRPLEWEKAYTYLFLADLPTVDAELFHEVIFFHVDTFHHLLRLLGEDKVKELWNQKSLDDFLKKNISLDLPDNNPGMLSFLEKVAKGWTPAKWEALMASRPSHMRRSHEPDTLADVVENVSKGQKAFAYLGANLSTEDQVVLAKVINPLRGFNITGYGNVTPFDKQTLEQAVYFVEGTLLDERNLPSAHEFANKDFQELFVKDTARVARGVRRINNLPVEVRVKIEEDFGAPQIYHSWNNNSVGYHEAYFVQNLGYISDEKAYERYKEALCASKDPDHEYWFTKGALSRCQSYKEVDELCRAYDTGSQDGVSALNEIYKRYGSFPFAEECKALVCSGCFGVSNEILLSNEVYSRSESRFRTAVKLGKEKNVEAVRAYSYVCETYSADTPIYKACEVALFAGKTSVIADVTAPPRVFGEDLGLFTETLEVREQYGADALTTYKTLCGKCARTATLFPEYFALIKEGKWEVCNKMLTDDYLAGCGDRKYIFDKLLGWLNEKENARADFAVVARGVYAQVPQRIELVEVYMQDTDIYELNACTHYAKLTEESGRGVAKEWLDALPAKAKGLIGSSVPPVALRSDPGYQWMVQYVFPKGNYSNYETNAACGDKTNHLAKYTYDKAGYVDEINGVSGYKVKDNATEDSVLLTEYSSRVQRIRGFVASRGPDNAALQKAFSEKVASMCGQGLHEAFASMKGLTLQEQLAALLLTQILKRSEDTTYPRSSAVLDLLVEYKYAFCEDLEAYVQRSADTATRYPDEVSKRAFLWNEFSAIYGENVKHVLRNEIMGKLEGREQNRILHAAAAVLNHTSAKPKVVSEKTKSGYRNIFANFRATSLRRKIFNEFGNHVKFSDDNQKRAYIEAIDQMLTDNADAAQNEERFFTEVYPGLVAICDQYRANIPALMEEQYLYDINRVQGEVSKYEELIETEAKEKRLGGPKDTLVAKKPKMRSIRQFFTKTRETANARMGSYLCISADPEMWKNEDYLELVMQDEETNECVGLTMLLNIENKNGKKYLWMGPNPFEGFLSKVSSRQCFAMQYQRVVEFAKANNFDGVVVPSEDGQILGACTNRGGDFPDHIKSARLRDKTGKLKIVKFDKSHQLGGTYAYSSGTLVWEKEAA